MNSFKYGLSLSLILLMQTPFVKAFAGIDKFSCFNFNKEENIIKPIKENLKKDNYSSTRFKLIEKMVTESYHYIQREKELTEKKYDRKSTLLVAEFPILARFEQNLLGECYSYATKSERMLIIARAIIVASEDGRLCPNFKSIDSDLFIALMLKHDDLKCYNSKEISLKSIKEISAKVKRPKKSGFDRIDSFLGHFIPAKSRFDITTAVNQLFTVDWFSTNRPKHVAQNVIPFLQKEEEDLKKTEKNENILAEKIALVEERRSKHLDALDKNMDLKNKVREQEFYLKFLGGDIIDAGDGVHAHYFSNQGLIKSVKNNNGKIIKITNPQTKESISGIYFDNISNYVGQGENDKYSLAKALTTLGIVSNKESDFSALKEFRNFNQTADNKDSQDIILFSQEDQNKYIDWVKGNEWDHKKSKLKIEQSDWPKTDQSKTLIRRAHMGYKDTAGHLLLKGVNVVHYYNDDYMDKLSKYPTPKRLNDDLEKTYEVIKDKYHLKDNDIIVHSLCLDGGTASYFGKKHPAVHLILDQTYGSFMDLAKRDIVQNKIDINKKIDLFLEKITKNRFEDVENQIKHPNKFWAYNKIRNLLHKGAGGSINFLGNFIFKSWNSSKNLRERHQKAFKMKNGLQEGRIGIFFTHQDNVMGQSDILKLVGESQSMDNMTVWSSPGNHGDKWTKLESSLSKYQLDLFDGLEAKRDEAIKQMKIAFEAKDFEKAGEIQQLLHSIDDELLKKRNISQEMTDKDKKLTFSADHGFDHFLSKIGAYNPVFGETHKNISIRDIDIKRLEKFKEIKDDPSYQSTSDSYLFKVDDFLSTLESQGGKIVSLKKTLGKIEDIELEGPVTKPIKLIYFSNKEQGSRSDLVKKLIDLGVLQEGNIWDGFDKLNHNDGSDRAYFFSSEDKVRYEDLVKDNEYRYQGTLSFEELEKGISHKTVRVKKGYPLKDLAQKIVDQNENILYKFE